MVVAVEKALQGPGWMSTTRAAASRSMPPRCRMEEKNFKGRIGGGCNRVEVSVEQSVVHIFVCPTGGPSC